MTIQSSGNNNNIFSEINITPLTDIFLVLLIIMMVMAPMFQAIDKNINMPEINNGMSIEDDKVVIAITKNSKFFINSAPVNPDELTEKLSSLINEAKNKYIVVKADTETKNKEIMKVIKAAKLAGYEKLTIAGEPLSKKQQKTLEKLEEKVNTDKTG
ncbi:MAG: biopolymer transporter ExbD [bacterium]